jgi:hypothetical protein
MKQIRENALKVFAQLESMNDETERLALLKDLAGGDDELNIISEFLDKAFDELDSKSLALLWYYCAQYRMYCEQMPAYVDFMPKMYNEPGNLTK